MIKKVTGILIKYFLNGVLFLTPIMLTIFIVHKILAAWDKTAGKLFPAEFFKNLTIPLNPPFGTGEQIVIPGLPLLASILVVILIGYVVSWWLSARLLRYIDNIFTKVPVVKFIYTIIKDTLSSLLGEKKSFSKVAVIRVPGTNMKMLGFITSEDLSYIGFKDHMAVYVMQSMQWAGVTLLVPKEDIEILEGVKIEEVMKFIVSAGAVASSTDGSFINGLQKRRKLTSNN
jgi:uncharacterized membrane protein